MRSNAIGFLFIGPYQVTSLCQQASNFRRPQSKRARGGHMTDIEFHS